MTARAHIVTTALLVAFLTGCDDPAKGKTQASVGSAKTAAQPAATGAELTVDTASSKLEFVGSKAVGEHPGGFKAFSGKARLADGKAEGGSVTVEIDMGSVFSDADGLTKHLKKGDFFEVSAHPKAKFESTSIKAAKEKGATHKVVGNLTLRGVTKSIEFPATIEVTGAGATVKSEFSLNRKDFGINYAGKADNLIRDGVVIKLDIKLKKA